MRLDGLTSVETKGTLESLGGKEFLLASWSPFPDMCHEFNFVYPYICIIPSCKGRIEVARIGLYDTHLFTKPKPRWTIYILIFYTIEIKSLLLKLAVLVEASSEVTRMQ